MSGKRHAYELLEPAVSDSDRRIQIWGNAAIPHRHVFEINICSRSE
jgi:hypothetical protein